MIVDINNYNYLPLFSIRRAEMFALENLPNKDKDILLPIILLRGWSSSNHLSNSVQKVEKVFGKRPWIIDIDNQYILDARILPAEKRRPVHGEIDALKNGANGYENWFEYLKQHEQLIPCLQLEDIAELDLQIDNLVSLQRGLAVRFTEDNIAGWSAILSKVAAKAVENVYVILDYGKTGQSQYRDILTHSAAVITYLKSMSQILPSASYILSSTTFPFDFSNIEGLGQQEIYERTFFNTVKQNCQDISLKYSDRGSTRAEKGGGGGAIPAPRIDYPLKNIWKISRIKISQDEAADDKIKKSGYRQAAKNIIKSDAWDSNMKVWGAKEIEASSISDHITSPAHSTAVRINIHLHQQLYYDAPAGAVIDTDDDWVD